MGSVPSPPLYVIVSLEPSALRDGHLRVCERQRRHVLRDAPERAVRRRRAVVLGAVHRDRRAFDAAARSRVVDVDRFRVRREPRVRDPLDVLDADASGGTEVLDLDARDALAAAGAILDFVHVELAETFDRREQGGLGACRQRVDREDPDFGAVLRLLAASAATTGIEGDSELRRVRRRDVECELVIACRRDGEQDVLRPAVADTDERHADRDRRRARGRAAVRRAGPAGVRDLELKIARGQRHRQREHVVRCFGQLVLR